MSKALILLIVLTLFSAGCSTFQKIPHSNSLVNNVNVDDKIRVETTDGNTNTFVVSKITSKQVSGSDLSITIQDIQSVEKSKTSAGKTALLSGVVVGGALAFPIVGLGVAVGTYTILKLIE